MATSILCVFAKLCFIAEAENSLYDIWQKINKLFRYHVITNNICPPGTALGTLTAIRKPNPTWKGDPGPMKHYSFVFGGCLHLWNSTEWGPVFSGTTTASSDKNGHGSNGTFHWGPRGRPQVQLWGYEKGR